MQALRLCSRRLMSSLLSPIPSRPPSVAKPAVKPGFYNSTEDHITQQEDRQQQPMQRRKRDKTERTGQRGNGKSGA